MSGSGIANSWLLLLATTSLGALWSGGLAKAESHGDVQPPRLILQITVDQLRGEIPRRYYDRLGEGGFRYLMDQGTVYLDAHHRHANTETIVGHTTLATGADPAAHGMVGNVWLDRGTGELTYNVEDAIYPLLIEGAGVDQATEIDPTQRAARTDGRSPRAILVSTFSDELALFYGGKSKVFAVSIKDRGAISMAGHSGKALWFSKKIGQFVTSRFYYKLAPDWVMEWNRRHLPNQYAGTSWELLNDPSRWHGWIKDAKSALQTAETTEESIEGAIPAELSKGIAAQKKLIQRDEDDYRGGCRSIHTSVGRCQPAAYR